MVALCINTFSVEACYRFHNKNSYNCINTDGITLTYLFTYLLIYLLNYLLTSCSKVIFEKLTDPQLVRNFPAFYGARRFITAFPYACRLFLSIARSIQSVSPIPLPESIIILSSLLRLSLTSCLFPSGFPHQNHLYPSLLPICASCPTHLILLDLITRIIFGESAGKGLHLRT